MSSVYPDVIMGLNPSYYWRMNRFRGTYASSSSFYTYILEETHKDTNALNNGTLDSEGWYLNFAMPAGHETPHEKFGPIAGGDSNGMMVWDTYVRPGPRVLRVSPSSITNDCPVGRNQNFSINIWFKTFSALAASPPDTEENIAVSGRQAGTHQHFRIAESQTASGNDIRISTEAADATQGVNDSANHNQFKTTEWNMLTYTSMQGTEDETTTDGQKVYLNGKLHATFDSIWGEMLDAPGPTGDWAYLYLMCAGDSTAEVKPGSCSETALFDKVLNASQIAEIYYHATSPSPSRLRGGLYRQLGRLV